MSRSCPPCGPPHPLRRLAAALALVCGLVAAGRVHARYMAPDIDNVPVDRVIANLVRQAAARPDDATLRLNLARFGGYALAAEWQALGVT